MMQVVILRGCKRAKRDTYLSAEGGEAFTWSSYGIPWAKERLGHSTLVFLSLDDYLAGPVISWHSRRRYSRDLPQHILEGARSLLGCWLPAYSATMLAIEESFIETAAAYTNRICLLRYNR